MKYVERNRAGEIVAAYSRPQAGKSTEPVADDSADVVAFRARAKAAPRDALAEIEALKAEIEALKARLP